MKVKVIQAIDDKPKFETEINSFIVNKEIIDIKYRSFGVNADERAYIFYNALILYK